MKYLTLLLPLFLLTGCALTRDNISLNYEPMADVTQITGAENTEVHVAVNDSRQNKERVGRKINGYGMQMASIVCENQIDELVKEALLKELANRGFVLNPQDPHVLINVEIHKMSNRFRPGFWTIKGHSETTLIITVQNPDGSPKYSKTFFGEGKAGIMLVASGKNAKIALEKSLEHAITQIIEDSEFVDVLLSSVGDLKEGVLLDKK